MSQETFGTEVNGEKLSEQDAAVLEWFQEQGFSINAEDPESILAAYATLEEEVRETGEDVIASAPKGLEDLIRRLQNPATESVEGGEAELPLADMAKYLGEKIDGEIDPTDTVLMATIYANLKSEVRGASGVFDTNPEVDPLYDLPIRLSDAFEKLLEQQGLVDYDQAA